MPMETAQREAERPVEADSLEKVRNMCILTLGLPLDA